MKHDTIAAYHHEHVIWFGWFYGT